MRRSCGISRFVILLIIVTLVASITSCDLSKPTPVTEISDADYTVSVRPPEALLKNLITGDEDNPENIMISCVKPVSEGTLLVWKDGTRDRISLVDPEGNILWDIPLPAAYSGTPVSIEKTGEDYVILSTLTDDIFHTQAAVTRVAADFSSADEPVQLEGLTDQMVYGFACTGSALAVASDIGLYLFDPANHFLPLGQVSTETPVYDVAVCGGNLLTVQDKDKTDYRNQDQTSIQKISCNVLISEVDVTSCSLTNTRMIFSGEAYAMHLYGDTEGFEDSVGISMNDGFYLYALDGSSLTKTFECSEFAQSLSIQTIAEVCRSDDGSFRAFGYYNASMHENPYDRQLLMQISPSSGREKTPVRIAVLSSDCAPGIELICDYVNKQNLPFTLEFTVYADMQDPDFDYSQMPAAKLAFLRDALSEDPPDLLILSPIERETFAEQNALLDLTPFIEASQTFDPDDMFHNVWSAITTDQPCDWIPPYFYLSGNMVSEEYADELGQGDVSAILAFYENHTDEPLAIESGAWSLYPLITGKINALSDGIGDPIAEKQDLVDLISCMVDLRQMSISRKNTTPIGVVTSVPGISELNYFLTLHRMCPGSQVFRGEFGQLDQCLAVSADGGLSISAGTGNADLCWSVIEVLLSEEILDVYSGGIPLRMSAFETMLLRDIAFVQRNDAASGEGASYNDGVLVPTYDKPLDAAIVAQYRNDVYTANGWSDFDEDLYVIILDELNPCLAREISPEEAADRLMGRVGLYQAERDNG